MAVVLVTAGFVFETVFAGAPPCTRPKGAAAHP